MKNKFKQDINFLENPLWFQDERLAAESRDGYVWQDKEGYKYRAGYKPPVKTDMVFLMYLLLKSQKNGWTERLYLSRYEIMKGCGLDTDQYWYKRLEDGLNRWLSVTVHFKGTFYNGTIYETLNFGIIDDWGLNSETGKLEICLNEKWLEYVKKSAFFKFIDFEIIKKLRSPLAVRLHEILIKSFQGRNEWQIDALKLAQKIPLNRKYASDIKVKIEPAVRRIYDQTDLKVTVESVKQGRGKILFVFRIKNGMKQISDESAGHDIVEKAESKTSEPLKRDNVKTAKRDTSKPELQAELKALKLSGRQIRAIIKDYEPEQIRRNIDMTLKKAESGEVRNVPGFLTDAIRDDYAKDYNPSDDNHRKLVSEANKCRKKNGKSCLTAWDTYKDEKTHVCHWCGKFAENRKNAGSEVSEAGKQHVPANPESLLDLIPVKVTSVEEVKKIRKAESRQKKTAAATAEKPVSRQDDLAARQKALKAQLEEILRQEGEGS